MGENSKKTTKKKLAERAGEAHRQEEKPSEMRSDVFESELTGTLDDFFDELEDEPSSATPPVTTPIRKDPRPPVPSKDVQGPAPPIKGPGEKKPSESRRAILDRTEKRSVQASEIPKVSEKVDTVSGKKKQRSSTSRGKLPGEDAVSTRVEKEHEKPDPDHAAGKMFPKRLVAISCVLLIVAVAALFWLFSFPADQTGPPVAPPKTETYAVVEKPVIPDAPVTAAPQASEPVNPGVEETAPEPPEPKVAAEAASPPAPGLETIAKKETAPAAPEPASEFQETQPASVPLQTQAEDMQPSYSLSKIETEAAQSDPELLKAQPPETLSTQISSPAPASAPEPVDDTADIRAFLTRWNAAWESFSHNDTPVETVLPYYSDAFASGGLGKTAWVKKRAGQYRQKNWFPVEIQDIRVLKPSGKQRELIRYVVHFQSPQGTTDLHQTLVLAKEPDGWKIQATHYPHRSYPYTVHVGSFKSVDTAEKLADTHRKSGLQSFWVRADLGAKGVWYRVFLDCYETRAAAEKIVAERGLNDVLVRKTPYAIHVDTYLSETNLTNRMHDLSKRGYSPYTIEDKMGRWHLFLGSFINRNSAKALERNLKADGIPAVTVVR